MSSIRLRDLMVKIPSSHQNLASDLMLFKQGDQVRNFYYVESGMLQLSRNTIDGNRLILHEANAGEVIAEASLFSQTYQCTAICAADTSVIHCRKSEILRVLRTDPDVMYYLLDLYSQQIRNLRTLSEIKNIRKSGDRMLAYFKVFANESGEIDLSPSIKDCAAKIGISHETFYRELNRLESGSAIKRSGRIIRLPR